MAVSVLWLRLFLARVIILLLLGAGEAVQAAPEDARVTSLPGFEGSFASSNYAGYVTIDEEHGRQLYYYFVTSERDPKSDPVVLWLNGGPGCSSFDGFVYEHGPFVFHPGKNSTSMPTLTQNRYTWAKVANVIYLDSPAGVGLSYSKNSADYITGDVKTAADSHTFLLKWFEKYPEFLSNALYISGESYAGVYVPTLSQQIVNGIEAGSKPALNFKGYMVGNGVTDEEFDGNALVPFAHGMGLISDDLFEKVFQACSGNYWNATSDNCVAAMQSVNEEVSELNMYDILEPCYHNPREWQSGKMDIELPSSIRQLGSTERPLPVRKRMFGRAWPLRLPLRDGYVPNWLELSTLFEVPCLDVHLATIWLNEPSVRQALHASPENVIGKWEMCTDRLTFHHDAGSMIPIHKSLTSKGYPALIFSGDHDMCVPYTGSEAWTRAMGYDVINSWHPWIVGHQVAGYSVTYDKNLTFATVKGAGHTVAEYKPKQALAMFQRWLAGTPL